MQRNTFVANRSFRTPDLVVLGHPVLGHVVDAYIERNAVLNGDISLGDPLERTTVRHNTIIADEIGVLALGGHHNLYPIVPGKDNVIENNTIIGGFAGIAIHGTSNWTVVKNIVHGATFGVWTEWGVFFFPSHRTVHLTPSAENLVANNDLRDNQVGVFAGAYSRNNRYQANNVTGNNVAGYFLRGAEQFAFFRFGPTSGNVVVGAAIQSQADTVIDESGCFSGVGNCPQLDDDGDGFTGEDPIDAVNNDGDLALCARCTPSGFSFIDEDPEETPNYITGVQSIYGPVIPPWAAADLDWDGLPDSLERKLSVIGFCTDPSKPDTDGDGIPDGNELRDGTLVGCESSASVPVQE